MDESLIPEIEAYCKKFETGSYSSESDYYLHYLWEENKRFRQSMEGRDRKIIELMREIGELRKQLKEKKQWNRL